MDLIDKLRKKLPLSGWHKFQSRYKKLKRAYHRSSNIHRKGGRDYKVRLQRSVSQYLVLCGELRLKVRLSKIQASKAMVDRPSISVAIWLQELAYYEKMLKKHIDLVDRRIMKGEKIDHAEKVFSIFEPHTEWIAKGKKHKPVELGHNVLIATDQYQFILAHEVMVDQRDAAQVIPLAERLENSYSKEEDYEHKSLSFDRGFFSKLGKKRALEIFEEVIMPRKGRKTLAEEEEENTASFKQGKSKHAQVESNINQLENNGVNRCPDKGLENFKIYVALGVLAYNLQQLGSLLIEQQKQKEKRARKKAA